MKKILACALLVVVAVATCADAGPIRNWIQSRRQPSCSSGSCASGSCASAAITASACPSGNCGAASDASQASGTECQWVIVNGRLVQVCPPRAAPQPMPAEKEPAAKEFAMETAAQLRFALLADLDRLLEQRSWVVSEEQKRRARALRAVLATDDTVVEKIRIQLP